MTIPADVWHVVFGGSLAGGEIWESGLWVAGAAPTTNGEANGQAEQWWAVLTSEDDSGAVRIHLGVLCHNTTTMDHVRVYSYPTGGSVAAFIGEFSDTPIVGGRTPQLPNQTCAVVSTRSESAGRRNRGRIYMPATGNALTTAGNFVTADIDAASVGWATALTDWNASGDNGIVSVVSRVGAGNHVPISACVVDSRPDIQRRRANKQIVSARASNDVT